MSTGMFENWKAEPVPPRGSQKRNSMWDREIPADLIRQMRLNPATTFLIGDNILKSDFQALTRSCPRPFRIQTRTNNDKTLMVWVSFDPGHWEKHEKTKGRKR